jgi:hypothetical protein
MLFQKHWQALMEGVKIAVLEKNPSLLMRSCMQLMQLLNFFSDDISSLVQVFPLTLPPHLNVKFGTRVLAFANGSLFSLFEFRTFSFLTFLVSHISHRTTLHIYQPHIFYSLSHLPFFLSYCLLGAHTNEICTARRRREHANCARRWCQ